jgi:hypothetical protein
MIGRDIDPLYPVEVRANAATAIERSVDTDNLAVQ